MLCKFVDMGGGRGFVQLLYFQVSFDNSKTANLFGRDTAVPAFILAIKQVTCTVLFAVLL